MAIPIDSPPQPDRSVTTASTSRTRPRSVPRGVAQGLNHPAFRGVHIVPHNHNHTGSASANAPFLHQLILELYSVYRYYCNCSTSASTAAAVADSSSVSGVGGISEVLSAATIPAHSHQDVNNNYIRRSRLTPATQDRNHSPRHSERIRRAPVGLSSSRSSSCDTSSNNNNNNTICHHLLEEQISKQQDFASIGRQLRQIADSIEDHNSILHWPPVSVCKKMGSSCSSTNQSRPKIKIPSWIWPYGAALCGVGTVFFILQTIHSCK